MNIETIETFMFQSKNGKNIDAAIQKHANSKNGCWIHCPKVGLTFLFGTVRHEKEFSGHNCLEQAKELKKELQAQPQEVCIYNNKAILSLAGRWSDQAPSRVAHPEY